MLFCSVAYYVVADVAEFVVIAASPYKNHDFPTNLSAIGGGLLNGVASQRCCVVQQASFALTKNTPHHHRIDP